MTHDRDVIVQTIPDEDRAIRELVEEAASLHDRVRAAFRARWDLEQSPTYETGRSPPKGAAYRGSTRSFFLNWAANDAGGLLAYFRQAADASAEQERHWYARDAEAKK